VKKPTLLTIFLIVFIDLVGFGLVLPVIPFLAETYHSTGWGIGLLFGVYSLMQFLLSPFWGGLSDRFGRRPIILASLAGSVASYVIFTFAHSYEMILVSRIVAGICGANIGVATAYIADITDHKNRAKGMGLIGAAFGIGFVLGPAVGFGLDFLGGIQAIGLGASLICLANFILAVLILPESLPVEKRKPKVAFHPMMFLSGWDRAVKSPAILLILAISFLLNLTFTTWETTFALLVSDLPAFHYNEREYMPLLIYVGIIVAFIQGGAIGRLEKKFGEKSLLLTGAFLTGASVILMPYAPGFITLLVLLFFWGVGMAFSRPIMSSLLSKEVQAEEQGGIQGVSQSVGSLTRILAPLIGGYLFDVYASLPYFIIAGLSFVALLMALAIKPRHSS